MPVSNYVIRRYTPPTCTLEVLAQSSALSRWMGKSVLKQLRFELHFDDPQLPEERRISIKGDRSQLESLCVAVTNYVQDFIEQPPEKFWATSEPQDSNISNDDKAKDLQTSSLQQINTLKSFSTQIQGEDIHLQPNGRMIHNLFIGNLASSVSGSVIPLSLLQLFDLATALDDYSNDVVALPTLNNPTTSSALPAWTPVAAVLVIGVAFLPMTLQYANHIQQQKTAKKLTAVPENIALNPSPTPNLSTPLPALTPPDSLLSSQPKPPLGTNVPLLGSTAVPPSSLTSPRTTLPTRFQTSAKSFPLLSQTPSNFASRTTSQTPTNLTNPTSLPLTGKTLTIPKTPETTLPNLAIPSSTAALPELANPPVNIQPNTKKNGTKAEARGEIPVPQTPPPLSTLSPPVSTSPDFLAVSPPVSAIPNLSGGGGRNQLANFQSSSTATPSSGTDALIAKLRRTHKNSIAAAPSDRSLVDATQLVEAKDYLKKHWQPPTQLKQTLEYSLVVGIDGSIERISPLGKAARDYVDRTGMPLIGERFVSPNKNGQSVRIRAVYSPDGKVQTFQESE